MIIYVDRDGDAHTVEQMHESAAKLTTWVQAMKSAYYMLKEAMNEVAIVFMDWWHGVKEGLSLIIDEIVEYAENPPKQTNIHSWKTMMDKHNHISKLNIKTRQRRSSFARHKGWSIKTTYQRG